MCVWSPSSLSQNPPQEISKPDDCEQVNRCLWVKQPSNELEAHAFSGKARSVGLQFCLEPQVFGIESPNSESPNHTKR